MRFFGGLAVGIVLGTGFGIVLGLSTGIDKLNSAEDARIVALQEGLECEATLMVCAEVATKCMQHMEHRRYLFNEAELRLRNGCKD